MYIFNFAFLKIFFFCERKKINKKTRGERKGENGEKGLYFRFAFPKMWGFSVKKKPKPKGQEKEERKGKKMGKQMEKEKKR